MFRASLRRCAVPGFLTFALFTACEDRDPTPIIPGGDPEAFRHLEAEFHSGSIRYRIDPVIPLNRRLNLELTFIVTNHDADRAFSGLSIHTGDLYHNFTGSPLGQVEFRTTWDGSLQPAFTDTIVLRNDSLRSSWIESRCSEFVYINCLLQDANRNTKLITTDSLRYECIP